MSIEVTLFTPPYGNKKQIEVKHIAPEDAEWFKSVGAKLSIEEIGDNQFAIYADVGVVDEEGEPDEALEISAGRDCIATMAALRIQAEAMMKKYVEDATKEQK